MGSTISYTIYFFEYIYFNLFLLNWHFTFPLSDSIIYPGHRVLVVFLCFFFIFLNENVCSGCIRSKIYTPTIIYCFNTITVFLFILEQYDTSIFFFVVFLVNTQNPINLDAQGGQNLSISSWKYFFFFRDLIRSWISHCYT